MTLADLLPRLENVKPRGSRWSACCPAHPDKSPSLSVSEGDRGLLIRCFAGCGLDDICSALGIRSSELFFDSGLPRGARPIPPTPKVDRVALAFRFDLAALDRRLRGNNILAAANSLDPLTLNTAELAQALVYVAQAYTDRERADLFERVADTLRTRDDQERTRREQ